MREMKGLDGSNPPLSASQSASIKPSARAQWRRELLAKEPGEAIDGGPMVPVEVVPERERRPRRRRVERSGFIEIEFGSGARVCIRGEVEQRTLRQVIELLR